MKRKQHLIVALMFLIFINFISSQITISLIALPTAMTIFPDVDAGTKYHRNIFTHSIIIWIFVFIFNPMLLTALVCLGVGVHCLCDISLKTKGGFYTIKWYRKGFNYKWSTIWLLLQFIGGSVILGVWLLWI